MNRHFRHLMLAAFAILAISCSEKVGPEGGKNPVQPTGKKAVGFVHCGTQRLENVIVTDGFRFAKTNAEGMFNLTLSDAAEYISIVTPTGYTADFSSGSPEFYRKVSATAATYDFDLIKTSDSNDYSFVVLADPQTKNEKQFTEFKGAPLDDIVATCNERSASAQVVGMCLGDVVGDAYDILPKYKKEMKRTGVPFYAVIGNHDHNAAKTGAAAAEDFKKVFGPLNYAFFIGNDLVIGLTSISYNGSKKFDEKLSEESTNFAANLLTLIPKGTHVYVAHHSPFHRWYESKCIEGGDRLLAALANFKVDFITGHTHVNNTLVHSGTVMEHNMSGFLGAWWYTDFCRDGSPRGYRVFDNRDGKLTWIYHSVSFGEGAEAQGETIAPGQSTKYPNAVEINLWNSDSKWSVKWSQGGAAMQDMVKVNDFSPRYSVKIKEAYPNYTSTYTPSDTPHVFKADPNPNGGPVKIEVVDRFGRKWDYEVNVK